jgi:hypothetical protein
LPPTTRLSKAPDFDDGVGTTNYWDITVDQQSTLQADSVEIEIEGSGTSTTNNTVCISQSDSGTATGCQ